MTKEEAYSAAMAVIAGIERPINFCDGVEHYVPESTAVACFEAGYALASSQWVAVDDALPQWRTNVLAAKNTGKGYYPEIVYTGSGSDWPYVGITHFMPLPTAP